MTMDYHITQNGEQRGPYLKSQLQAMWYSGGITADTLYWCEGMKDWRLLSELFDATPHNPDEQKISSPPVQPRVVPTAPLIPAISTSSPKPMSAARCSNLPPYFAVSVKKLVVMSVCTFGLYHVFWFYKQWNQIRVTNRQNVLPFIRAIFSIFTCHSLFSRVKHDAGSRGIAVTYSPGILTAAYIAPILFFGSSDVIWPLSLVSLAALIPVQRVANSINGHLVAGGNPNEKFTGVNIVVIVIGGFFMLFGIFGSFTQTRDAEGQTNFPDEQGEYSSREVSQRTASRSVGLSGVYQDGGWHWDFRSNGTVQYLGMIGGIRSGFEGTYNVNNGIVSVVLENGKSATFELEGNGDLTCDGERLPRVR